MRTLIKAALLPFAFLLSSAANAANLAEVNLPFSFVAEGHSYPAGRYLVEMDSSQSFVTLTNRETLIDHFTATVGPADEAGAPAILDFDVCSGQLLLREIHMGARVSGNLAARSKRGLSCPANASLTAVVRGPRQQAGN